MNECVCVKNVHIYPEKIITSKSYRPDNTRGGRTPPSFTRDFSVIYITFIGREIPPTHWIHTQFDSLSRIIYTYLNLFK